MCAQATSWSDQQRSLQFGAITLTSNGFDQDLNEQVFHPDNLLKPGQPHPANWERTALRKMHESLGEESSLPESRVEEMVEEMQIAELATSDTKEAIDLKNTLLSKTQQERDSLRVYSDTIGFFQDIINARVYCADQQRVGVNAINGRVHSDIFIRGRGEALVNSPAGVQYGLKVEIWVEGYKHCDNWLIELLWPDEKTTTEERQQLREFIMSHQWPSGFSFKWEHVEVEGRVEGRYYHASELLSYALECRHLDVWGSLDRETNHRFCRGMLLSGTLSNMQAFVEVVMAELDPFFRPAPE